MLINGWAGLGHEQCGMGCSDTYEPPLVEGHVLKRDDGTVIIREGFSGDVEPPHRLVPEG